jgi:hypothetical protein
LVLRLQTVLIIVRRYVVTFFNQRQEKEIS